MFPSNSSNNKIKSIEVPDWNQCLIEAKAAFGGFDEPLPRHWPLSISEENIISSAQSGNEKINLANVAEGADLQVNTINQASNISSINYPAYAITNINKLSISNLEPGSSIEISEDQTIFNPLIQDEPYFPKVSNTRDFTQHLNSRLHTETTTDFAPTSSRVNYLPATNEPRTFYSKAAPISSGAPLANTPIVYKNFATQKAKPLIRTSFRFSRYATNPTLEINSPPFRKPYYKPAYQQGLQVHSKSHWLKQKSEPKSSMVIKKNNGDIQNVLPSTSNINSKSDTLIKIEQKVATVTIKKEERLLSQPPILLETIKPTTPLTPPLVSHITGKETAQSSRENENTLITAPLTAEVTVINSIVAESKPLSKSDKKKLNKQKNENKLSTSDDAAILPPAIAELLKRYRALGVKVDFLSQEDKQLLKNEAKFKACYEQVLSQEIKNPLPNSAEEFFIDLHKIIDLRNKISDDLSLLKDSIQTAKPQNWRLINSLVIKASKISLTFSEAILVANPQNSTEIENLVPLSQSLKVSRSINNDKLNKSEPIILTSDSSVEDEDNIAYHLQKQDYPTLKVLPPCSMSLAQVFSFMIMKEHFINQNARKESQNVQKNLNVKIKQLHLSKTELNHFSIVTEQLLKDYSMNKGIVSQDIIIEGVNHIILLGQKNQINKLSEYDSQDPISKEGSYKYNNNQQKLHLLYTALTKNLSLLHASELGEVEAFLSSNYTKEKSLQLKPYFSNAQTIKRCITELTQLYNSQRIEFNKFIEENKLTISSTWLKAYSFFTRHYSIAQSAEEKSRDTIDLKAHIPNKLVIEGLINALFSQIQSTEQTSRLKTLSSAIAVQPALLTTNPTNLKENDLSENPEQTESIKLKKDIIKAATFLNHIPQQELDSLYKFLQSSKEILSSSPLEEMNSTIPQKFIDIFQILCVLKTKTTTNEPVTLLNELLKDSEDIEQGIKRIIQGADIFFKSSMFSKTTAINSSHNILKVNSNSEQKIEVITGNIPSKVDLLLSHYTALGEQITNWKSNELELFRIALIKNLVVKGNHEEEPTSVNNLKFNRAINQVNIILNARDKLESNENLSTPKPKPIWWDEVIITLTHASIVRKKIKIAAEQKLAAPLQTISSQNSSAVENNCKLPDIINNANESQKSQSETKANREETTSLQALSLQEEESVEITNYLTLPSSNKVEIKEVNKQKYKGY